MNTLMMQMRHTAHELRVTLDQVLQGGDAAAAPQNSHDESIAFLAETEAEMRAVHNIPEVRAPIFIRTHFWEECSVSLHFVIVEEPEFNPCFVFGSVGHVFSVYRKKNYPI